MLTRQEQSTLRARTSAVLHARGVALLSEGAANDQVIIIRSGWCKATAIKADRPVLLRLYGPGELVGVSAALTGTRPAETVTAISRVHGFRLSARGFADFLYRAPNASTAQHRLQQWRLEEADRIRTIRDYPTATQRLAGLLTELCRPENGPMRHRDGTLSVPGHGAELSQENLGSWIGDSRKTVGRALSDLRGLGVATAHLRGHVWITAPDRLFEFAETADAGRPTFGASRPAL
jgi:CRP-like cAMP-binding protein